MLPLAKWARHKVKGYGVPQGVALGVCCLSLFMSQVVRANPIETTTPAIPLTMAAADDLMSKGQFDLAEAAYKGISERASDGDSRLKYTALGQMALAMAAQGNIEKAAEQLHENASRTRADLPDIAVVSEYDASLLLSRIDIATPSNLTWLAYLRGVPIPRAAANSAMLADALQAANTVMPVNTSQPLPPAITKSRVLYLNYALDTRTNAELLPLFKRTETAMKSVADRDGLLALAEAEIGRAAYATDHQNDVLKAATSALSLIGTDTDAIGLRAHLMRGRVAGFEGLSKDALELTSEAYTLAVSGEHENVALELEAGAQYAAILNRSGQADDAKRVYNRLLPLASKLQTGLTDEIDPERRASLRDLMKMALLAEIDFVFKDPSSDQAALEQAREALELSKTIEFQAYFESQCLSYAPRAQGSAWTGDRLTRRVDGDQAVIYPVSFGDHTSVLVQIGDQTRLFANTTTPMGEVALKATAASLRDALRKPVGQDWEAPARALYQQLMPPEEEAWLHSEGVKTLVYAPDQILRNVPLSVLYRIGDGGKRRFIVQDYAVATVMALNLMDRTPVERKHPVAVLAGLSEGTKSHSALAQVDQEIFDLGRLMPAVTLRNGDFTYDGLRTRVTETHPTILHIASHGIFGPTRVGSYVFSHADEHITSDKWRELMALNDARGLDLLTLSACDTAWSVQADDDRAMLGLAGLAYQAGAHTVIGSIWEASEDTAPKIFTGFYRNLLKAGDNRATALQKIQLDVLGTAETAHPYYWAGYIVIGNWQ